jgi:hypothetical protein
MTPPEEHVLGEIKKVEPDMPPIASRTAPRLTNDKEIIIE